MIVLETDRLVLRWIGVDDAAFYLELINEPGWHRYIGDKGIRTLEAARESIQSGPMTMYRKMGFGLYVVELKQDGTPIGLCGLIKRDSLEHVDIGFAFLERFQGKGYAEEAARATLAFGQAKFALPRLVAITSLDNERSIRLLEKIGFAFEKIIQVSANDEGTRLFGINFSVPPAT